MTKQYFYLVVRQYDELTIPCKIFLQERDAIVWGRRKATVVLAKTKDSNHEFFLYKQEITRKGELQFVKPLYPYLKKELVDADLISQSVDNAKGADYDIDIKKENKDL